MIGVVVVLAGLVLWPQIRARSIERQIKPIVSGLAGRDAGARCPRYLTSMFGNAGSVSLDANGVIADHTDLTGPVCDGLDHLLSPGGKADLACLTDGVGRCSPEAITATVSLLVVTHEAMHLRGVLDERLAECTSIGQAVAAARLAGLSDEHGRMMGYLHYDALNSYTPSQYRVSPADCAPVAEIVAAPPGTPASRAVLRDATAKAWRELGS